MYTLINVDIDDLKHNKVEFEDYNGWSNHITWDLNLHLTNEEYLYEGALDSANEGLEAFIRFCLWHINQQNEYYIQEYNEIYYNNVFKINFKEIYDSFIE